MKKLQTTASVLAVCAAVALPVLAAEKFGAKLGLWETTTTINMGGMTLPPELTANMPPQQRAQMEQMMKSQMAAMGASTTTTRSCLTPKDLENGAFQPPPDKDMKCKTTVTSSTAKHQEATVQCTTPTGPADGKLVVDAVGDGHVKGTMQLKTPQMSMETKFESKWLAADCGTTK